MRFLEGEHQGMTNDPKGFAPRKLWNPKLALSYNLEQNTDKSVYIIFYILLIT